jgi:hypothetical protein
MLDNLRLSEIATICFCERCIARDAGIPFTPIHIDGHGTLYSGKRVSYR